jgi:uncharacterized protein (TIGR02284 family)
MATSELTNDLNELLKGEISACETYRQALEKIEAPNVREILKKNHMCHSSRVDDLTQEIVKLGGKPAAGSGVWGGFAKMMEGGATMFGDKAAVSVLEEGEDAGLADYKKMLDKPVSTSPIIANLKTKQEGSHAKCRDLKHSMK